MRTLALVAVVLVTGCGDDSRKAPRDAASDARVIDGALVDSTVVDGVSIDAAPDGPPADAGPDGTLADAPPDAFQSVTTVTCGTEVATVTTVGMAYSPSTATINAGEIVKFVMPNGTFHDVAPNTTGSDPGLVVPFNTTRCLKFAATGTFGFHCSVHFFTGSITVN